MSTVTFCLRIVKATGNLKRSVACGMLALLIGAVAAYGQQFPPGTIEYSAKFVCGTVPTGSTMVLPAGGSFATSINIHNPALPDSTTVTFQKKAVQSIQEPPPGVRLPSPGPLVQDTLPADFAMEVDCAVIRSKLLPQPPPAGFVEGWVVIYSLPTVSPAGNKPNPLDVVGVYTDKNGALYLMPATQHQF